MRYCSAPMLCSVFKTGFSLLLFVALWASGHVFAAAEGRANGVSLDELFSDHMVLQRNAPLPVWGSAPAGTRVTVEFGGSGAEATANAEGKWMARLPALPASKEGRDLSVRSGGAICATIHDVLVGEVWICAGQSNMEFRLNQEATWASEQKAAALPLIRLRSPGWAGQGVYGAPLSADAVARLTPARFYSSAAWIPCEPAKAGGFSAVGYFFGKEIQHALDVPVGLINLAIGGSPAEAWISRAALARNPALAPMVAPHWLENQSALEPWCIGRALAHLGTNLATAPADDLGPNHLFKPAFLWDAGPARLMPFAIRGVLWYQGESNALSHLGEAGVANPKWRVEQHEALFKAMVQDWRAQWGLGDFPWLICQLSSIDTSKYKSHFWPEFRDQQRRAISQLPNCALAVCSDIGNPTNVHPTNKHELGKRLAAAALRVVYRDSTALPCPLPIEARNRGGNVAIAVQYAGTGLSTCNGPAPAGFELAGADGVFHPAEATLAGQNVVVHAAGVTSPKDVRYGWQPYSIGNVVNSAGFPLSTFQLPIREN